MRPQDAGVASAMVNTSQQVGGSLGTALLNTIATSATSAYVGSHLTDPSRKAQVMAAGVVHGYTHAIGYAVGAMLIAGCAAAFLVNARPVAHSGAAAPNAAH